MAALRERHPARDGMGHADRPRLHDAFSLDAQSRRVCLSFARRRESDPNTHGFADVLQPTATADSNSNGNSNCDGNTDTETYTHTEICTDAEAASYAAAAAIRP